MKFDFDLASTKVQTFSAVALHATTACTDDTGIAGPLIGL